jgi:hypothetical protein
LSALLPFAARSFESSGISIVLARVASARALVVVAGSGASVVVLGAGAGGAAVVVGLGVGFGRQLPPLHLQFVQPV